MSIVTKDDILDTNLNFLGKSYGGWMVDWNNWIVSGDTDSQDGPVFFLRGSLYEENGDFEPYEATGSHAVHIDSETGIFLPIMSSTAYKDAFPSLTTHALRLADVRNDINRGTETRFISDMYKVRKSMIY